LEKKIISNELYCDKNKKIKNIVTILNEISQKLSIRYISYLRSYIIGIKISKIRLNLINIIKNVGGCCLSDTIRIYFNSNIRETYIDNIDSLEVIEILDKYFQCISFDIYQSKDDEAGIKKKKNKKYANEKSVLVLKQDDSESYAKVVKMLGSGRLTCKLPDGREILGIIPGRMKKKKQWIKLNDIILVSIRDYQEDKADILCVYNYSDVETLKSQNLIPKLFDDCQLIKNNTDINVFEFTNEEIEKENVSKDTIESNNHKKPLLNIIDNSDIDDNGSDIDIDDI